jgi:hypothetical protein
MDMEWKEVEPEQNDWEKQYDVVAYYGSVTIGSIVYCGEGIGWQSVIDGNMDFMEAASLEAAKEEMINRLDNYFTDQINYYKELQESLDDLN